jgi:hypothetical protein
VRGVRGERERGAAIEATRPACGEREGPIA